MKKHKRKMGDFVCLVHMGEGGKKKSGCMGVYIIILMCHYYNVSI